MEFICKSGTVISDGDSESYILAERSELNELAAFLRWGDNQSCPHCGNHKFYWIANRSMFKCAGCKERYTAFTDTVFANTKLHPAITVLILDEMFIGGCSTHEIAHLFGITQVAAWHIKERYRHLKTIVRGTVTMRFTDKLKVLLFAQTKEQFYERACV